MLVVAASCAFGEEGSGTLVTRRIEVPATVRALEVGDAFETTVNIASGAPDASFTIDDNLVDHVVTEIDDDVLQVELSGRVRGATLRLHVSMPDLDRLQVSGAVRVEVNGTIREEVEIEASGATNVVLDAVELDRFEVVVSGASSLDAAGSAEEIDAEVSGASEADLAAVEAQTVTVNVSGASHVEVDVREELEANASGASEVRYRGDPDRVRIDASGSSSVERA